MVPCEVVVHPEPAHGVVGGREDAHGHLVGSLAGDAPSTSREEVAVFFFDLRRPQAAGGVGEIEIHAQGPWCQRPGLHRRPASQRGWRCRGGEVAEGGASSAPGSSRVPLPGSRGRAVVAPVSGEPRDPAVVPQGFDIRVSLD